MPTGYTCDIQKGIGFNKFVLGCAKAFGACVTMRDDPHDTPIPEEFEPNTYDLEATEDAKKELKKFKKMSVKEANEAADKEYKSNIKEHNKTIKEKIELKKKCEDMLAKVQEWLPPTPDHVHFKDFMIEQISGSIDFDCDLTYYLEHKPTKLTGKEWLKQQIDRCEHDIEYHAKGHKEEVERVNQRNSWIKELRGSLKS